jgi:hypothetical protein
MQGVRVPLIALETMLDCHRDDCGDTSIGDLRDGGGVVQGR